MPWQGHIDRAPLHFDLLVSQEAVPITSFGLFPARPAIYVFYDGDTAVHVGRTRNLRQRLRGHTSVSHYSASFAFKMARELTGRKATYRKGEGRGALVAEDQFRAAFEDSIQRIRAMSVRFLEIPDPIDQYLLELYAALKLGTSTSEFDTH